MVDTGDQRLLAWIGGLAGRTKVFLASPAHMEGKQGISLYLLEVLHNPPPRGLHRAPLSVWLRYLITTWLEDPMQSDRLLVELMFAAMEEKEYEVEPAPLPLATWQAFGVAPRPAVLLRVPLNKPRADQVAPKVRGKAVVRFGSMRAFQGQVLGPGGVPVMGATVKLPSLQRSARTDHHGRFHFGSVPTELPVAELLVNARGREVTLPVPADAGDGPLVIELNETEI